MSPSCKTPSPMIPTSLSCEDDLDPRIKSPDVGLINGVVFAQLRRSGCELFTLSVTQIKQLFATSTAFADQNHRDGNSHWDSGLDLLPEKYREFADVFSRKEADKLPPHCHYDHHIPIPEGSVPPFGPMYQLSPVELDPLRDYISKNLSRGFIRHSQSPCAAPILFTKKPDSGLRLCVDYRGLNSLTVKSRYPLPLINELLDRIAGARCFTKLDMREGYYLLRMALREEWKTAFRCRYGLFEYQVVPFGVTGARERSSIL
jgi:hypothetical protein